MKLITAIIRTEQLAAVETGLEGFGVKGLTVSEASGYGRQRGLRQTYRGASHTVNRIPKVRVEILAEDLEAIRIIEVILDCAHTGEPGDGKVWVTTVDQVIRVSDRAEGEAAI